jgi:glycosyltransferase involved in cell wall biosynthesis
MNHYATPDKTKSIKVSVLVPVYNGEKFLPECLDSILAQDFPDMEILIADDASTDNSAAVAERYAIRDTRIRRWKNPANLGLAGNFNRCLREARGEYIKYVLQDDKLVSPLAIRRMVELLDQHPEVALAGSAAQILDENSRVTDWRIGFKSGIWSGRQVILQCLEQSGNLIGEPSVVLFRRRQTKRGFDEQLRQLLDLDLWFHLLAQGDFAFLAGPLCAFRRHATQQTNVNRRNGFNDEATLIAKWYAEPWLRSALTRQALFTQIRALRKNPAPEAKPLAAQMMRQLGRNWYCLFCCRRKMVRPFQNLRRHYSRRASVSQTKEAGGKRILVIDSCSLTPQEDSGSLRMFHLLRLLVRMGFQVTFLADNLQKNHCTDLLESLGVHTPARQQIRNITRFLKLQSAAYDCVILSRLVMAEKHLDRVKKFAPRAKVIYDTVDLHFVRIGREAAVKNDVSLRTLAAQCREKELALARKAHTTLVVSPVEKQILESECPGIQVDVVSNIHEVEQRNAVFSGRRDLLFIGGFLHQPNVDAVKFFARDIFPQVQLQLPGVRFHVLGGRVPDEISRLANPHLHIHGLVEDVRPFFNNCKLSVAPLRFGAGIKGKINLSQSFGVPVVATSLAVEGMQLEHGHSVLTADTPETFARAVVELYTNEALWQRLSENGVKNLEQHFSFKSAQATLETLFQLPAKNRITLET